MVLRFKNVSNYSRGGLKTSNVSCMMQTPRNNMYCITHRMVINIGLELVVILELIEEDGQRILKTWGKILCVDDCIKDKRRVEYRRGGRLRIIFIVHCPTHRVVINIKLGYTFGARTRWHQISAWERFSSSRFCCKSTVIGDGGELVLVSKQLIQYQSWCIKYIPYH